MRPLSLILIVAAIATGCGNDGSERDQPPVGPLAETLAEIGAGGTNASLGVSWVEPEAVVDVGGRELLETVLAPNADTVVAGAEVLKRRFGFDPLAAERLVSVGGSYAFGLRLDGVDGRGLARALIAAGGRSRTAGGLELIEIGDYAVVPQALLDADVNGLGAFDALGRDLSVLAISDRARASLLGEGERMIDQPAYPAAAACLGDDVLAARMVPDKQLLANEQGIDLVAVGVSAKADVLCTIGGTSDRAAEIETALRNGLAPTVRDPVTGELYGRSIASVEVTTQPFGDVETVRAEVALTPEADPGFLLSTIATGSLVSLINGEAESALP